MGASGKTVAYRKARKDIAAVKTTVSGVLHDIEQRALQQHGALGVSNEVPFSRMVHDAAVMGLPDGPTGVHEVTAAKLVLRGYRPSGDLWPSEHLPRKLAVAKAKHAAYLHNEVENQ